MARLGKEYYGNQAGWALFKGVVTGFMGLVFFNEPSSSTLTPDNIISARGAGEALLVVALMYGLQFAQNAVRYLSTRRGTDL